MNHPHRQSIPQRFLAKRMMALVFPGAVITSLVVVLAYAGLVSINLTVDRSLAGLPRVTYDLLVRPPA